MILRFLLASLLVLICAQTRAQTSGWEFPTTTAVTVGSGDNGKVLSSDNVPGTYITVTLPTAASVGQGWQMGFSTAGSHGIVVNAPTAVYILAGQKTMTSFTAPSNQNYEYFLVQSDGTNFRLLEATDATERFNGIRGTVGGQVWNYLYSAGYSSTLTDNGTTISSQLANGAVTITLPSTPLIPNGWAITVYSAVNAITVQPNSVSGGSLYVSPGQAMSSYTFAANSGASTISFDGSNFRVVSSVSNGIVDARAFGATCGSADSTASIQAAFNYVQANNGGTVLIPCPMTVAGQLNIVTGGIMVMGNGPVYYPGQSNIPGPPVWPPTSGPALNCTSTSAAACILINGAQGTAIEWLNMGNPQVFPPNSGTWVPTVYPPLIATSSGSGWQGLTIEHVSCNAAYDCLDIEGSPNYTGQFTGTQIVIRDLWCNPCIDYGVKIHQIDNPFILDHLETTYSWGLSQTSSGAYLRLHARGIVVDYCAACNLNNLDLTFGLKSGIEFNNATVTNNFGSLTFAATAMAITNANFNQVCQAMTMPGGNGTQLQLTMVNANFWGDQSGFACSSGLPLISFNSNDTQFSLSHVNVEVSDTFMAAGCGGGCSPGGGAIVKLDDIAASNSGYSSFTAGQHFIDVPSGTTISFGSSNKNLITGGAGAGTLLGPGPDSTQGYESLTCVGGGPFSTEGAACLGGGANGVGNSGSLVLYDTSHVEQGFVGYLAGPPAGVTVQANGSASSVYIKAGGANVASFLANGGHSQVNFSPLPTSPISGTGSGYVCVDNMGNLYIKSACP